MKPIDLRNETWEQVLDRVTDKRTDVHFLLQIHGPCTCRQLAERANRDILSIAPRVTELFQLGLVELAGKDGTRGIYKALDFKTAQERFEARKAGDSVQAQLALREA